MRLPTFSVALLLVAACTEDIQLAALDAGTSRASRPASENCADGPASCDDALARLFRYALCSCEDVSFGAPFETSGSIGTNGRFVVIAPLDVAGSWISSGSESSTLSNAQVHVSGNLKSAGELKVVGAQLKVERDLWAQAAFSTAVGGSVRIAGVTYQPPGHVSAGDFKAEGGVRSQAFSVGAPCACADKAGVDFDRVASRFDASAALLGSGADLSRELHCGHYRLQPGSMAGARFRVSGRVVLFVDGDLELAGHFQPEMGPGAELDVYVRGALTLAPGIDVGVLDRPSALRFFVGGPSRLLLGGSTTFAAQVYAPLAEVRVVTEQTFHGALHVASYIALGHTAVRANSAVDGCKDGPVCTTDADCEDPLLCTSGHCGGQD